MQPAITLAEPERESVHSLEGVLANRRWWRRRYPFHHVVAYNVFTDEVYAQMVAEFQKLLEQPESFQRNMPGYDATAMEFSRDVTGSLSVFVSRAWHDMIAAVMDVRCTLDIVGSLHHHAIGSGSGRPHNDLNPGWFADSPNADGVNVADGRLVEYRSGRIVKPGITTRQVVRAIAVMYYMNNPPWFPGDGGETCFYRHACDPVDHPVAAIPPISNSLVCFECTPYSYHSFITNRRTPRDSVTLWLHRTRTDVAARWGEDKLVHW